MLILVLLVVFFGNQGPMRIGICIYELDDPIAKKYAQALEEKLLAEGYEVFVRDAKNDQSTQNKQIAELLEAGVDGLIINPVMTSALEDIVDGLKEADIPVIFANREPEQAIIEHSEKFVYVGTDITQLGTRQAEMVLALPDKGDVNGDGVISCVILQDISDSVDTTIRTRGFVDAMINQSAKADVLRYLSGEGDYVIGRGVFARALSELGKDIEVVISNNDRMALGALEAITDGGRSVGKDIYLLGMDAGKEALIKLQNGLLTGTVAEDVSTMAIKTQDILKQLLSEEKTEERHYVAPVAVTRENAEEWMAE